MQEHHSKGRHFGFTDQAPHTINFSRFRFFHCSESAGGLQSRLDVERVPCLIGSTSGNRRNRCEDPRAAAPHRRRACPISCRTGVCSPVPPRSCIARARLTLPGPVALWRPIGHWSNTARPPAQTQRVTGIGHLCNMVKQIADVMA